MGGCCAGCEFLRLRNPKRVQTAFPANHGCRMAEGIQRRSTQFSGYRKLRDAEVTQALDLVIRLKWSEFDQDLDNTLLVVAVSGLFLKAVLSVSPITDPSRPSCKQLFLWSPRLSDDLLETLRTFWLSWRCYPASPRRLRHGKHILLIYSFRSGDNNTPLSFSLSAPDLSDLLEHYLLVTFRILRLNLLVVCSV
jgi:hypothetical protein